jgi:hypothetical protein
MFCSLYKSPPAPFAKGGVWRFFASLRMTIKGGCPDKSIVGAAHEAPKPVRQRKQIKAEKEKSLLYA